MRRRKFVGLLLAAMTLAAAPSSPRSSSGLAKEILGTWRLVSIENRDDPSKPWEKRFGEAPHGYLAYDADGRMSVQICRLPRPRFVSGKDGAPTPEEAREAYLGYAAYFGTYSVDEPARVITHHVEASLWPSFAGTDQRRPAELAGNNLTLSDGKTFRVVWERMR